MLFCASVWDSSAFEWIDPYMPFYKIGSGDLTAYPILEIITSYKKPIILSTGMSTIDEIKNSGVSIIWIEHIVHALLSIVDRLIVINFGKKIADGDPQSIMKSKEVREIYIGIEADA